MSQTPRDTSFCRTGTCDCPSFVRQIYRPALCRNCFHTIAVHSQGEWKEDIEESTGRVYYVCVATGERLFARPGAVDLQTAVDRLYPNKRGTEPRTLADGTAAAPIVAKVVPEKIRAWTAFENAQALRSQAFAQRQNATASGPVDELLAFSEETAEYVPEEDQADLDGPNKGISHMNASFRIAATSAEQEGGALPQSPPGTALSPMFSPAASRNSLPFSPLPLRFSLEATSDTVPIAVHSEKSVPEEEEGHETAPGIDATAADTLPMSPSAPVDVTGSPVGSASKFNKASPVPPPPKSKQAWGSEETAPQSITAAGDAKEAEAAAAAARQAAVTAEWESLVQQYTAYLDPLAEGENPWHLSLNDWKDPNPSAEDLTLPQVFRCAFSAHPEQVVDRYLVVTPVSIQCIQPHPIKLGVGVLKWEKSLLSLGQLATHKLPTSTTSQSSSASSGLKKSTGNETVVTNNSIFRTAVFGQSKSTGAATTANGTVVKKNVLLTALNEVLGSANDAQSPRNRSDANTGNGNDNGNGSVMPVPALPPRNKSPAPVALSLYFRPETDGSIRLLRLLRHQHSFHLGQLCFLSNKTQPNFQSPAPPKVLAPLFKEGALLKRKRAGWKDTAPATGLAWKSRHFVLNRQLLLAYKQTTLGAPASESLVLDGWTDIRRVGRVQTASHRKGPGVLLAPTGLDRSVDKPHAFCVAQGTDVQVYRAKTEAEADAWVTCLSVNALFASAATNETCSLLFKKPRDLLDFVEAVRVQRARLVEAIERFRNRSEHTTLSPAPSPLPTPEIASCSAEVFQRNATDTGYQSAEHAQREWLDAHGDLGRDAAEQELESTTGLPLGVLASGKRILRTLHAELRAPDAWSADFRIDLAAFHDNVPKGAKTSGVGDDGEDPYANWIGPSVDPADDNMDAECANLIGHALFLSLLEEQERQRRVQLEHLDRIGTVTKDGVPISSTVAGGSAGAEEELYPPEVLEAANEAEELATAMGGLTVDFLVQLPYDVAKLIADRRGIPEEAWRGPLYASEDGQGDDQMGDQMEPEMDEVVAALEAAAAAEALEAAVESVKSNNRKSRIFQLFSKKSESNRSSMSLKSGQAADNGSTRKITAATASGMSSRALARDAASDNAMWCYIDDAGWPQGPFPESRMHAWLWSGYFHQGTRVRYASVLPVELQPEDEMWLEESSKSPLLFLPLGTLFPNPMEAFAHPTAWVAHWRRAMQYQGLVEQATGLGIPLEEVQRAVELMQTSKLQPCIAMLLEILEQQRHEDYVESSVGSAEGLEGLEGAGEGDAEWVDVAEESAASGGRLPAYQVGTSIPSQ